MRPLHLFSPLNHHLALVSRKAELINRWHETQAVYSCDFQPLPLAQLKRLLAEDDHDSPSSSSKEKEKVGSSSAGPIIAGGRQYRLATGGGDSKVRVRLSSSLPFFFIIPFLPCSLVQENSVAREKIEERNNCFGLS